MGKQANVRCTISDMPIAETACAGPRQLTEQLQGYQSFFCASALSTQPIRHRGAVRLKGMNPATALGGSTNPIWHMRAPAKAHGDRVMRTHASDAVERVKKRWELTGGCVFRKRPQLILPNHLCCLTSDAPLLLPRRVHSLLSRRRVMMSLPALRAHPRNEEITEMLVAQRATELGRSMLTMTPWACPGNERIGSIYFGTCRCAQHP